MSRPNTVLICAQLRVRDPAKTERFYRALGLRVAARGTMENGERLAWMRDPTSGALVELYWVPRRSRLYAPFPPRLRFHTPLLFGVRDLPTALRRLRKFGARPEVDFAERGVRVVFLRDPDGTLVELVSWADRSKARATDPPLLGLLRAPPALFK